jgi:murein tripeptide amidase MpaA
MLLTRPRVENTLLVGPGGVKKSCRSGKIIIAHQNRRQVSRHRRLIKAAATSSSFESKNDPPFDKENERNFTASAFQLSPMQPSSAVGTHLRNVLERDPNAFEDALEKQLRLWAADLGEEEEK